MVFKDLIESIDVKMDPFLHPGQYQLTFGVLMKKHQFRKKIAFEPKKNVPLFIDFSLVNETDVQILLIYDPVEKIMATIGFV